MTIREGEVVFTDQEDPVAGDRQLLVRVAAAGLNGADLIQVRGGYPPPPGIRADIPGLELAGEVVSVGRMVERFGVGDQVMALAGGAAQAELAVVDEDCALPVPDGLSIEAAGGFCETFFTAYDALFRQAGLAMGERVLVTGAAGGVGTAAVQLVRLAGALPIASSRHADLLPELARLGAAAALGPDEALEQGPFQVVLELVGAPSLGPVLHHLAEGARIVVVGIAAGAQLQLDLGRMMRRRASLRGTTLRSRTRSEKGELTRQIAWHLLPLLGNGDLSVPLAASYPMDQAPAAYARFRAGAKLGKVILTARP